MGRRRQFSSIVTTLSTLADRPSSSPASRSLIRAARQLCATPLRSYPSHLGRQCSVCESGVYLGPQSGFGFELEFGIASAKRKVYHSPSTRLQPVIEFEDLRARPPFHAVLFWERLESRLYGKAVGLKTQQLTGRIWRRRPMAARPVYPANFLEFVIIPSSCASWLLRSIACLLCCTKDPNVDL